MKSLKSVYANLLTEAILDQSTFLLKLINIVNRKTSDSRHDRDILDDENTQLDNGDDIIMSTIDNACAMTGLFSLDGKENKKARKKAEIEVAKEISQIQGLDGTPINFKAMRPLYDSIIQYIESKSEVSVDDCLLAADYYMKDFYPNAQLEEKSEIDRGSFNFNVIFRRTKFYEKYLNFKSNRFDKVVIDTQKVVYKDDDILIVHPLRHSDFVDFIKSQNRSLNWCTQSPRTWLSYSSRQHLMIARILDKDVRDKDYIISLKVEFDGTIDADGTCNALNDHMGDYIYDYITQNIENEIKKYVNANDFKNAYVLNFKQEEIIPHIINLIDINNFDELEYIFTNLLSKRFYKVFNFAFKSAYEASLNNNSTDRLISVIADIMSSCSFDDEYILSSENHFLKGFYEILENKNISKFYSSILEKACDRRSHPRYYIFICESFLYEKISIDYYLERIANYQQKLNDGFIFACNTNNALNFERVLNSTINSTFTRKTVLPKTFDKTELFKTQGFLNYIINKKLDLIKEKVEYEHVVYDGPQYISNLILNNKSKFIEEFESYKENRINSLVQEKQKIIDSGNDEDRFELKAITTDLSNVESLDLKTIDLQFAINLILKTNNLEEIDIKQIEEKLFNKDNLSIFSNLAFECLNNLEFFNILFRLNNKIFHKLIDFFYRHKDSSLITDKTFEILDFHYKELSNYNHTRLAIYLSTILSKSAEENFDILRYRNLVNIITQSVNQINLIHLLVGAYDFENVLIKNKDLYSYCVSQMPESEILGLIDQLNNILIACTRKKEILDKGIATVNMFVQFEKVKSRIISTRINLSNLAIFLFCANLGEISSIEKIKEAISFFINLTLNDNNQPLTQANKFFVNIACMDTSEEAENFKYLSLLNLVLSKKEQLLSYFIEEVIENIMQGGSSKDNYITSILFTSFLTAANRQNISIDKNKLVEIILDSQGNGIRLALHNRHALRSVLENFVSISSDNERNYLGGKDLVLIRETLKIFLLKKRTMITYKYKDYLISLIKKLNGSARKMLTDTIFADARDELSVQPDDDEESIIDDAHERLIRKYVNMILS